MRTYFLIPFILFLCLATLLHSCNNEEENNKHESPSQKTETDSLKIENPAVVIDSSTYNTIISNLSGIEKFYVRDDYMRLHSLLQFNNNELHAELEKQLKDHYEYPAFLSISKLDVANGYIEFHNPQLDCKNSMVYWNTSSGTQLIGMAAKCCTMFCDAELSFMSFNAEHNNYTDIEISKVIPDINAILDIRPADYSDGGFDAAFDLPQIGKNITYCAGDNCVTLEWKDGIFTVKPPSI